MPGLQVSGRYGVGVGGCFVWKLKRKFCGVVVLGDQPALEEGHRGVIVDFMARCPVEVEPQAQPSVVKLQFHPVEQVRKGAAGKDRKSTRLNSSHVAISY